MGLVTTRDLLRAKLRRAFDAGRAFAVHDHGDADYHERAADRAFDSLMDAEYVAEPNLDVRKP